jgi:hypothetical protein
MTEATAGFEQSTQACTLTCSWYHRLIRSHRDASKRKLTANRTRKAIKMRRQ